MESVFPFTNENLSSYKNLYKFENAKVLSVLGSGDQYFSSLLYGAKEIEVYDCNFLAWDLFVLKYYGILIFDYEEFYYYFVVKNLDDLKYLNRLLKYIPTDIAKRIIKLQKKHRLLSNLLSPDIIDDKHDNGSIIPYFAKESYYKLQSILRNQKLPNFYLTDIRYLPDIVGKQSYDIILTSNIFDWLYVNVEVENVREYKELLNRFNYGEIQVLYSWHLPERLKKELEKYSFEIEKVPSTKVLRLEHDWVTSLRSK